MMDIGRGKRIPALEIRLKISNLAAGHASTDQCGSDHTKKIAAPTRNAMQPGCGAAYPTMIRESYPVDQAGESSTRQIEGTEPGRSSAPALVILQHIQKPVSGNLIPDTGLHHVNSLVYVLELSRRALERP